MERINEGIRQSRITHDDCLRQQRQREEELQDLIRTMDEREIEYQETRKVLIDYLYHFSLLTGSLKLR